MNRTFVFWAGRSRPRSSCARQLSQSRPFRLRSSPILQHMKLESRAQAFNRVMNRIRRFLEIDSVEVAKSIREARDKELWKEKYSSWSECCEKEFGKSRQRLHQIIEGVNVIEAIQTSNAFDASDPGNKAILHNLSTRQVKALSNLPTDKQAEILTVAIKKSDGKSPKVETITTARLKVTADTDNLWAYTNPPRDVHTTKQDTETAIEFAGYPKEIRVTVKNAQEELEVRSLLKRLESNDGAKKNVVRDLIASLVRTYKELTGKKLVITGADAGQIRRLVKLNGEDCSGEIIDVFSKACKADGFFARQSHQISTFVKHFGNIRNEVNTTKAHGTELREVIHVKSI